MEIFGVSALASVKPDQVQSVKTSTDSNFFNSLADISKSATKSDVPQVYAGDSKEFEFWLKDEKVASKPFKWRTKDDVLAEIANIIEALTEENSNR